MNRHKFIQELRKNLSELPEEERENAITFYEEYFEEAGEKKEQKIIEELVSPQEVAKKIKEENSVKQENKKKNQQTPKKDHKVLIIILIILAFPIGLPLALAAFGILLAICIVIFSIYFALGVVIFTFFAVGILYAICGMGVSFFDLPTGIAMIGSGFLLIAIAMLFSYLIWLYTKGICNLIKWIGKKITGKKKRDEVYEG